MKKKRVNYRLSDPCIKSISFLLEKKWGKDATHVIECAVASAEAMWHMREKLNQDTQAITLVEQAISSRT